MWAVLWLRRPGVLALLATVVLIGSPGAALKQSTSETLAIIHVNVIDGTGGPIRRDQTVVSSSGRITAIGDASRTPVPPGLRTIDGTGKYLIPGLWDLHDLHVHTRYEGIDHLLLFIANGVTAIRDMGGPWEHLDVIRRWRGEIATGNRVGPRIVAAGALLDGPGSELDFSTIVKGPDEGRAIVRRLKESGADFVKIYSLLNRDSFLAIVDEGRRQNLAVAGHPPLSVGVREASQAGVLSLEHLPSVILASSLRQEDILSRAANAAAADLPRLLADSRGAAGFDPAKAADVAALLKHNRTVVVPTLSNPWTMLATTRKEPRIGDRLRYVPPAYRTVWAGAGNPNNAAFETARELARILHKTGVELLAGTDAVKAQFIPGFSLHDELSLLVSIGMSPNEAIEAATRKSARLLGFSDIGTIAGGNARRSSAARRRPSREHRQHATHPRRGRRRTSLRSPSVKRYSRER